MLTISENSHKLIHMLYCGYRFCMQMASIHRVCISFYWSGLRYYKKYSNHDKQSRIRMNQAPMTSY